MPPQRLTLTKLSVRRFTRTLVQVLVIMFSAFFGFILAELEGWADIDGFYYVTSMLCSLPEPLTDVTPVGLKGLNPVDPSKQVTINP